MTDEDEQQRSYVRDVWKHARVLGALRSAPRRQVDIVDMTGRSRHSVSRALDRLEEMGLTTETGGSWELTLTGESAYEITQLHVDAWSTLANSAELLAQLPNDAPIGCEMMNGMDVAAGVDAAPQAAFGPIEESIRSADHIQGYSPIVVDRYVDVVYDEVVNHGTHAELVLPKEVIFATVEEYPQEWQDALAAANYAIWRMDQTPDFGLLIVDQAEVWVGIYRDGTLTGTLKNDTQDAVEWALERFKCCRSDAVEVLPPTDT